jgi:hypothetical protein
MPNDEMRKAGCRNCSGFRRCFPEYADVSVDRPVMRERTASDVNAFGAFTNDRQLARYLPGHEDDDD